MDKAPVGITITDPDEPDNRMVYANEYFRELSGYDYDEIVGRNCRFMQGEETDPETVAEIRTAIDEGEPVSTVLRNYRNDGTMFWSQLSIAPVRDETGAITNFVGFQEDVTERVERERQLTLAETLFDNTQDALFVIEVTGERAFRIQRVNDVYEELTGLSNEKIQGKSPREVVGDEFGSEIEAKYTECVERRETIKYHEQIPVDGEPRQWQTKVTPVISDGTVVTLVGAMRDVTAAKE